MLTAGDKGEGSGEHVRSEEFHPSLDDRRVGRNGGCRGTRVFDFWTGREHSDRQKGGPRKVCEGAIAEDITIC